MERTRWLIVSIVAGAGCGGPSEPAAASPGASPAADSTQSADAPKGAVPWARLNAATFERARVERRIVLIDGSAKWCHWCRVMEATTYRDPEVQRVLAERFLAVRVDVDARPDFEERYRAWGWPATVLMTPDARELGKYKGYMPPEKLLEILRAAASLPTTG